MGWENVVAPFIPVWIGLVKEALNEDYETARGILLGIVGNTSDNKVVIEQVLARAKLEALLESQK
jgi:hypothetical protein